MTDYEHVIFNEGYRAYQEGVERDDNPYDEDSLEGELWDAGWDQADSDIDDA